MTPPNLDNLILPDPPKALGAYSAVVIRGSNGAVSGQFPMVAGSLQWKGSVGKELTIEEGCEACRIAVLNVLAQIGEATSGFARFAGLLRLEGHVASAADFRDQPRILDTASEIMVRYLGSGAGAHARAAFAPSMLPLGAAVELCVTFTLKGDDCF